VLCVPSCSAREAGVLQPSIFYATRERGKENSSLIDVVEFCTARHVSVLQHVGARWQCEYSKLNPRIKNIVHIKEKEFQTGAE